LCDSQPIDAAELHPEDNCVAFGAEVAAVGAPAVMALVAALAPAGTARARHAAAAAAEATRFRLGT
jgi:hypothetical protein